MPKKKATESSKEPNPPKVKRATRPENCLNHKFVVETDGKVDMVASHEVGDNSVCFNCGLYFSTWTWYSDKITDAFWKGVDNEAGQTINYIAQVVDGQDNRSISAWGATLLAKLRERRKKNGQRI